MKHMFPARHQDYEMILQTIPRSGDLTLKSIERACVRPFKPAFGIRINWAANRESALSLAATRQMKKAAIVVQAMAARHVTNGTTGVHDCR